MAQIRKHWFFIGIGIVVLTAFFAPAVGEAVRRFRILNIGIFLAFLVTGLTLETSSIFRQLRQVRVLAAALVSSLFLIPLLAWFSAQAVFGSGSDFAVGALIIGIAPVTIASGTVMTAIAMGNVPLSLFICVAGNFTAILTIPFLTDLLLQFGRTAIDLPAVQMLTGLSVKVLLPTVIGQLLRPMVADAVTPYKKAFSVFNQCIVLMIILNAVSSSAGRILQAGAAILLVFAFMAALHGAVLALNFAIAKLIRLDRPSTAAFTIHTSQKTLTVSYLVWADYFADAFPMALIPGIAYHLTQMIVDTVLAHRFRKSAQAAADSR